MSVGVMEDYKLRDVRLVVETELLKLEKTVSFTMNLEGYKSYSS